MPKPAITTFSSLAVNQSPTNKDNGLYAPELTQDQIDTISADALRDGGIVYNTGLDRFQIREAGNWEELNTSDANVEGPEESIVNNIATFADIEGTEIQDSGVPIASVPTLLHNSLHNPFRNIKIKAPLVSVNEIGNLGHIRFTNDLGIIFVDGLMPVEFITNDFGSDSQVCSLFTGGLPSSSTTPSALLELQSETGALVFSRLTPLQIDDLFATPGMVAYNTELHSLSIHRNGFWGSIFAGDSDNNLDLQSFRIVNGADPVDLQDFTTKNYVDSAITSGSIVLTGAVTGSGLVGTPVSTTASAKYILQTANASVPNAQILGSLTTGLLKNTTTSGVLSIGIPGTDYYSPGFPTYFIDTVGSTYNFFGGTNAGNNTMTGTFNIGVGYHALILNTTGNYNIAIGLALSANTTGSSNIGLGSQALISNSTGNSNIGLGSQTLFSNSIGNNNIGLGGAALLYNSTGNNNIGLGGNTLQSNTTGNNNIAIGYNTGFIRLLYNNCVFLGSGADASVSGLTNAIAIGYNTQVAISNALILGSGCNVGINITTPNAPLQFPNTLANRIIVLNETANNDNQVVGLGTATNIFRFQVPATTTDFVYYAGTSSTTSNEVARITGTGNAIIPNNVGIGITPTVPLHVKLPLASSDIGTEYARFQGSGTRLQFFDQNLTGSPLIGAKILFNSGAVGVITSTSNLAIVPANSYNVGINDYVPACMLSVVGNMQVGFASGTSAPTNGLIISGNVGIGTATTNAPLQFSNTFANRKIVLFELANNDHQFTGIGSNSNIFRFQLGNTSTSFVYYAGTSSTTSIELFRITGTDIRSSAPIFMGDNGFWLRAASDVNHGMIYNATINGPQFRGFSSFSWNNGTAGATELMRLTSTGLGIGTATINASLQFSNTLANRKIVLYEFANNNHQYSGFGTANNPPTGDELRYQIYDALYSHAFYAGTSSTTSQCLMRINGNGYVGIATGTLAPEAPLQFGNSTDQNRFIVLTRAANNDHEFNGFGYNSSSFALRYQISTTNSYHIFYAATSTSSSNELARITGTGNLIVAGTIYGRLASGLITMQGNAVGTTVTTGGTFYKIGGTTSSSNLNQFTAAVSNRATYSGSTQIMANINVCLSASHNGVATDEVQFALYKNGVQVANSIISGAVATTLTPYTLGTIVSMSTSDYIEVWVTHPTSGKIVTVKNLIIQSSTT